MKNINYKYIDKGIRDTIKLLNDKGWTTCACCEGHFEEVYGYYFGSYICFRVKVPKEYFPNMPTYPLKDDDKVKSKYKTPITIVGMGYKNWIRDMEYNRAFYWQHTKYKRMSREEQDREHEVFLKELYEWAENLPMYSEIEKVA